MNESPENPRKLFADKVARLQLDRGVSDEAIAARAELDPGELERILQAGGPVPLDLIYLLAGALEVEPGELLGGIRWIPDGKGGGAYRKVDPDGG